MLLVGVLTMYLLNKVDFAGSDSRKRKVGMGKRLFKKIFG
jgi:hypothetical protein